MGTDIHMAVEKKVGGKWISAGFVPMEECWSCEGSGKSTTVSWVGAGAERKREDTVDLTKPCGWCEGRGRRIYQSRNYDLFAMLADVRNGAGFAGCKTGDGFVPIAEQRGLPEDRDPMTGWDESYDDTDLGDHSQSWLTLQELLAYDWTQTTWKEGVVSGAEYLTYRVEGKPDSWSGGVSGRGVIHISIAEMELKRLRGELKGQRGPFGDPPSEDPTYYTTVRWKVCYKDQAGTFYIEAIPALQKLAEEVGGPENVRIVFGFDS